MVQVTDTLAALSPDVVTLYHTTDPLLSHAPIIAFHGPSTTSNSTHNSSRIQVHIVSSGGFQSYPRITISPNSPLYAAVNRLPRDEQGDEICRGLAVGLLKYFKELPEVVKSSMIIYSAHNNGRRPGSAPALFGEQHAADLASSMARVENTAEVLEDVQWALQAQQIMSVDVDLVLPPGSIVPFDEAVDGPDEDELEDQTLRQYGSYAPLVKLFGSPAFLPTSKLRRAPSRPTSLNRTKSFLKDQKMSLRREMGELVDTEERYVIKMHDLVNKIAVDFRLKAKNRTFGSSSPSDQDLQRLFPKSLDQILEVNSQFLQAIQQVMDETEEEAMQDLETDSSRPISRYGGTGRQKDPTGALAFAKILQEWFPQFMECYQDYIRASQDFPQLITSFMKQQSSFSQRVQQTGEQQLRSAIIEPVQRLPRYSLFIDNIVNYLPLMHPALQPMLRARDVITSICSMDPPTTDKSQAVKRLKNLIDLWPAKLVPEGRLIAAADFSELAAPYRLSSTDASRAGMFLLFAECVVIVRKTKGSTLSARGVMAEVDKPTAAAMMASVTAAAGGQKHVFELAFSDWHALSDTRFTESSEGHVVWMTSSHDLKDMGMGRNGPAAAATVRAFLLQGAYEAKASRWTEEVTKGRVEGRFSEAERESEKWSLRNVKWRDVDLNVYAAVFEEGIDTLIPGRKEPASIRIVVDHQKGTKGAPVGHYGIDIVANVTTSTKGSKSTYRLEVDGLNDKVFIDDVDDASFMPVLAKRGECLFKLYGVHY